MARYAADRIAPASGPTCNGRRSSQAIVIPATDLGQKTDPAPSDVASGRVSYAAACPAEVSNLCRPSPTWSNDRRCRPYESTTASPVFLTTNSDGVNPVGDGDEDPYAGQQNRAPPSSVGGSGATNDRVARLGSRRCHPEGGYGGSSAGATANGAATGSSDGSNCTPTQGRARFRAAISNDRHVFFSCGRGFSLEAICSFVSLSARCASHGAASSGHPAPARGGRGSPMSSAAGNGADIAASGPSPCRGAASRGWAAFATSLSSARLSVPERGCRAIKDGKTGKRRKSARISEYSRR